MADIFDLVKLSALPQAAVVYPWDVFPLVQGGETKIASIEKLPGSSTVPGVETETGIAHLIIPEGKLMVAFSVRSTVDGSFDVGLTLGGTEVAEGLPVEAGEWSDTGFLKSGAEGGTVLYFKNLPGVSQARLFLIG